MSSLSNTIKFADALIKQPRITEKATDLAGAKNPVYSFEVMPGATKPEIAKAIKAKYKVTPIKVAVVNLPAKVVIRRGKKGTKPAVKKALVTLKAGDKIDLI